MSKQGGFLGALADGDVGLLWRMWGAWFPDQPQPANWQEAEIQLHAARSATEGVETRLRCYSHHWLADRGLPSLLPDELKPAAEQHRPKIVSAVGFSWDSNSPLLKPAKGNIVAAVTARINEMAADGLLEKDPDYVRREMMFTKNRALFSLFGNTASLTGRNAHG